VEQVVAQVQVKLEQQLVVHDLLGLQVLVGFSHPLQVLPVQLALMAA
jgi:hypothetical protein